VIDLSTRFKRVMLLIGLVFLAINAVPYAVKYALFSNLKVSVIDIYYPDGRSLDLFDGPKSAARYLANRLAQLNRWKPRDESGAEYVILLGIENRGPSPLELLKLDYRFYVGPELAAAGLLTRLRPLSLPKGELRECYVPIALLLKVDDLISKLSERPETRIEGKAWFKFRRWSLAIPFNLKARLP